MVDCLVTHVSGDWLMVLKNDFVTAEQHCNDILTYDMLCGFAHVLEVLKSPWIQRNFCPCLESPLILMEVLKCPSPVKEENIWKSFNVIHATVCYSRNFIQDMSISSSLYKWLIKIMQSTPKCSWPTIAEVRWTCETVKCQFGSYEKWILHS